MAARELAVKFSTDGFTELRQQLSKAAEAFDSALESAKKASREAIAAGHDNAEGTKEYEDAQKKMIAAAKRANSAIAGSYRELGIKSTKDIEAQKKAAISAYDAIRESGTASAEDIGNAKIALKNKLKELDAQLKVSKNNVDILGKGFTIFKGVLTDLISSGIKTGLSSILGMFQKAVGFVQKSVGVFMGFDGAMKAFAAKSVGATEEQIARVEEEVKKLGAQTSKTATQVANAAAQLAAAGFSADQTADSLRGIVMASEASGESLQTASSIVGATLNQFRLDASESGRIANILAAGANASATSIGGLGEGLKYLGPIAGGSNQKLEDMVVVLGMISNAGLEAGQAGRNFTAAFERIQMASAGVSDGTNEGTAALKAQQKALQKLGVQFRDSNNQMRPFLEVLPELAQRFNQLGAGDQDLIRKQLFGTEGGRAIMALLSQVETRMDGVVEAVYSANDGIGAAAETSQQLLQGLGPALELLNSAVEDVMLELGEAIAPALDAIVRLTTDWVRELGNTEGLFDGVAAIATRIRETFEENPQIIQAINQAMTNLVQGALQVASDLALNLLNYLAANPRAVADVIGQFAILVGGVLKTAAELAWQILDYLQRNPETIQRATAALGVLAMSMRGWLELIGAAIIGWQRIVDLMRIAANLDLKNSYKQVASESFGPEGAIVFEREFEKNKQAYLDSLPWWQRSLPAKEEQRIADETLQDMFGDPDKYNIARRTTLSGDGSATSGASVFPVATGSIGTSPGQQYGAQRPGDRRHAGVDINAAVGEAVRSVVGGTIQEIEMWDANVNSHKVVVLGQDGISYLYGHVVPRAGLQVGQAIAAGEAIATVSPEDSLSDGVHLHFQMNQGGKSIDPTNVLKGLPRGSTTPSALSGIPGMPGTGIPGMPGTGTSTTGGTAATSADNAAAEAARKAEAVRQEALRNRNEQQRIADQEAIANLRDKHEREIEELERNEAEREQIQIRRLQQGIELQNLESQQAIAVLQKEREELQRQQSEGKDTAADYAARIKTIDMKIEAERADRQRRQAAALREMADLEIDLARLVAKEKIELEFAQANLEIDRQQRQLDEAEAANSINRTDLDFRRSSLELTRKQLELNRLNQLFLEGGGKKELDDLQERILRLKEELASETKILDIKRERAELELSIAESLRLGEFDLKQRKQRLELAEATNEISKRDLLIENTRLQIAERELKVRTLIASIPLASPEERERINLQIKDLNSEIDVIRKVAEYQLETNWSLGQSFRDLLSGPMANFFSESVKGAKSIGEAFQDMALSILDSIGKVAAEMATNSFFDLLGIGQKKEMGGLGGAIANLFSGGISGLFGGAPASLETFVPTSGFDFLSSGFSGFNAESLSLTSLFNAPGFSRGGFSSRGGIVHPGEFVLNSRATKGIGLPALLSANNLGRLPNLANRGISYSGPSAQSGIQTVANSVTVNINDRESRFFKQSRTLARELAEELRG